MGRQSPSWIFAALKNYRGLLVFVCESWNGWFMAYLANVFLTKLKDPILPRQSRDRTNLIIHSEARYSRYHHRQLLFKISNSSCWQGVRW